MILRRRRILLRRDQPIESGLPRAAGLELKQHATEPYIGIDDTIVKLRPRQRVHVPFERNYLRFVDPQHIPGQRWLRQDTRCRRRERKRSRNGESHSKQFGLISLSRPGTNGGEKLINQQIKVEAYLPMPPRIDSTIRGVSNLVRSCEELNPHFGFFSKCGHKGTPVLVTNRCKPLC